MGYGQTFSVLVTVVAGLSIASAPIAQASCPAETKARTLDAGLAGPRLRTPEGPPMPGRPFSLRVDAGPPGAAGLLVLGDSTAPFVPASLGATFFPGPSFTSAAFVLDARGVSPTLFASAPLDPALCGVSAIAQAAVVDPSAPGGIALSNGLELVVGAFTWRPLPGLVTAYSRDVLDLDTGDLDGDGLQELVCVLTNYGYSVAFGRPSGGFSAPTVTVPSTSGPRRLLLEDLDADGALDMVLCYATSSGLGLGSIGILLGTGTGTFLPEVSYPTADTAGDVAAADLDGDGDLDLAVALLGGQEVDVFEGLGDGSFLPYVSVPLSHTPEEVVAADFDGDGRCDLVVPNDDGGATELVLLLGNGDLSFAPPLPLELGATPEVLRAADLTGDGLADLIAATSSPDGVAILVSTGGGAFAAAPSLPLAAAGRALTLGDLDRDGHLDLLAVGFHDYLVAYGRGDGTFDRLTPNALNNIVVAPKLVDLSGDGIPDLIAVVSKYLNDGILVLRGEEDGRLPLLQAQPVPPAARRPIAADFDDDGAPDLLVTSAGGFTVFLGDGDGELSPLPFAPVPAMGAPTTGDFDEDGFPDLAFPLSREPVQGAAIQLGGGDGSFGERVVYPCNGGPASLAVGDLDGDGHLDLAAANLATNDVSILLGDGRGAMGPPLQLDAVVRPAQVLLADFDDDGVLDLACACGSGLQSGTLLAYRGRGDGTFFAPTSQTTNISLAQLVGADFDEDGTFDLLSMGQKGRNRLFRGRGDGTFRPPLNVAGITLSGFPSSNLAVGDVDLDGHVDLLLLAYESVEVQAELRLGNGDGSFQKAQLLIPGDKPSGMVLADFDLDGAPDLVLVEIGQLATPVSPAVDGQVLLLRNLVGQ